MAYRIGRARNLPVQVVTAEAARPILDFGVGEAMALYRIYRLNNANRIITGSDVVRESDDAAFEWAKQTFGVTARAEIWNGERCVGRLPQSRASFDAFQTGG